MNFQSPLWQNVAAIVIGLAAAAYLSRWLYQRATAFASAARGRTDGGAPMCSSCRCGGSGACGSSAAEPNSPH